MLNNAKLAKPCHPQRVFHEGFFRLPFISLRRTQLHGWFIQSSFFSRVFYNVVGRWDVVSYVGTALRTGYRI